MKFLSELIDLQDLQEKKLNLITAPTGAGKTTFAKDILAKWAMNTTAKPMLYLIDTFMGKTALMESGEVYYTSNDVPYYKHENMTVMTYAGFAYLAINYPENDFWQYDSVILCDEMQNLVAWSKWETGELNKTCLTRIHNALQNNIVVAITATPRKVVEEFGSDIHEVPLHGEPMHYETNITKKYSQINLLIRKIEQGQKGIIYIEHISQIKKFMAELQARGIKTNAIWSTHNVDHPMSDEQKKIIASITSKKMIPDDVDVLFINKSCETSVNIFSHVDFMIVHTSDPDAQTQARGRYRADLDTLYLYDDSESDEIVLDDKWLNKMLFSADKKELCAELNITDKKNGGFLKWPAIRKILEANDYLVADGRMPGTGTRYVMIN